MKPNWQCIDGVVVQGHQVASGKAECSRYPAGTIQMQKPFFQQRGLDIADFHEGTLNISIHPYGFTMKRPRHTFRRVEWTSRHPPEDFSFSPCSVISRATDFPGWIYYPHPETKETHFQDPSVLEILTELIPGIGYGDRIMIRIDLNEIVLKRL